MNGIEEAELLLAKADRFCRSARLLLEADDTDSACSRAYYAMFDAARAALLFCGEASSSVDLGKTHRGVIGRFSERLVKSGVLPIDLGRGLRKAEEVRVTADYRLEPVDDLVAAETVAGAERFLAVIRSTYAADDPDERQPG